MLLWSTKHPETMLLDVPPPGAFIMPPLERIGKKRFLSIPKMGYTDLPDGVVHGHD